MSPLVRKTSRRPAPEVFAALGDPTRLRIVSRLARAGRCSLSELTKVASISRQGITKHLRVLEKASLLRSTRVGRETVFELNPLPLGHVREVLDQISAQWDDALSRLKVLAED